MLPTGVGRLRQPAAGDLPSRRVCCLVLREPSLQGGLQRSEFNSEEKESPSQGCG